MFGSDNVPERVEVGCGLGQVDVPPGPCGPHRPSATGGNSRALKSSPVDSTSNVGDFAKVKARKTGRGESKIEHGPST